MDFFGLGGGEILLILVVALILFGPGKIPEIARGLGKTMHAFRKASTELTTAVTREIEEEKKALDVQKALTGQKEPAKSEPAKPAPGPDESADVGANI